MLQLVSASKTLSWSAIKLVSSQWNPQWSKQAIQLHLAQLHALCTPNILNGRKTRNRIYQFNIILLGICVACIACETLRTEQTNSDCVRIDCNEQIDNISYVTCLFVFSARLIFTIATNWIHLIRTDHFYLRFIHLNLILPAFNSTACVCVCVCVMWRGKLADLFLFSSYANKCAENINIVYETWRIPQ